MKKDFKIGLGVGLLLALGAAVWFSTMPNLSAEARALQSAPNTTFAPPPNAVEIQSPKVEFQPPKAEQPSRIHVVQKGETLSAISSQHYDSPRQWQKILTANRNTLPDPNRLAPGFKLIIPE